jgi:hypothetical protein
VAAQQAAPSVTLFSSGTALVRRSLPIALPSGSSVQSLALGVFDPASFAVLDPAVRVDLVRYDAAFTEASLLRRNIGTTFTLLRGDGPAVRARLLALDPERWALLGDDGSALPGVVFERPGRILWDADRVPLQPVADVGLTTPTARNHLPVMYRAPGGSWQADYRVFLGPTGRIEGNAAIMAGSLDLQDAEVQLLAGNIGRPPSAAPMPTMAMARAEAQDFSGKGMSTEAVGEARLYTLPGRVSFMPGLQVVAPLFAPTAVAPELRLTVPGAVPFYGGIGQETDEVEVPVMVSYRLPHESGSPFGDLALPAGGVTVYSTDSANRIQLVGNGAIGHTAPGEPVEVATGTAFDVSARRTQTEYTTVRTERPSRTTATIGYTVTLRNAKDEPVTVEVREERGGEWSVVSSSVPAVKRSSSRTVFPVSVPARGEATLNYRLRVVW